MVQSTARSGLKEVRTFVSPFHETLSRREAMFNFFERFRRKFGLAELEEFIRRLRRRKGDESFMPDPDHLLVTVGMLEMVGVHFTALDEVQAAMDELSSSIGVAEGSIPEVREAADQQIRALEKQIEGIRVSLEGDVGILENSVKADTARREEVTAMLKLLHPNEPRAKGSGSGKPVTPK